MRRCSDRRGSSRAAGLAAMLALAACAAAPAADKPAPTSAPAGTLQVDSSLARGPTEERWLSLIVQDELRRCRGPARRKELDKRLQAAALARLACGRLEEFAALSEIVGAMRATYALGLLEETADGARLASWLLDHPAISRLLFRALTEVRSPKDALARFNELRRAAEEAVVAWPNLAVAFATSQEQRFYRDPPEPASRVDRFRYYATAKKKFRYDLKKMPFELSRYLADTRTNVAEREWAYRRYGRSRNPSAAYFHVKYDHAHFLESTPKKIADKPYSLQNLARYGGVCIDQAYYASEACKATGIPATVVYGRGGAGVGHAWLAYFQMNPAGTAAMWNTVTGRYASQLYFTGNVTDPASDQQMLDSELTLLGSAALLPLPRREEAVAATFLALLVDAARGDDAAAADLTPLRRLAESYRERTAGKSGLPALQTKWIAEKRKLDRSLVEDLIDLAIQRNLAYTPAWRVIVKLRKDDRLPVQSLDRFFSVLIEKTAGVYPEHSCAMVLEIVPTLPELAAREKAYKRSMAVYGKRPDLRGRILIALGDDYRKEGQKAQALTAYQTAATKCVQVAEVVVEAAAKAEEMLVEAKKTAAAIRLYHSLFRRTVSRKMAREFRTQTARYQLGKRLASLLRSAGKTAAAEQILAQIEEPKTPPVRR